jgi:hypothetical protein
MERVKHEFWYLELWLRLASRYSGLWKGVSLNSVLGGALYVFQTLVGIGEPVFKPLERGDPDFWHLEGSSYLPNSGWDGLSLYSGLWKEVSLNSRIWRALVIFQTLAGGG